MTHNLHTGPAAAIREWAGPGTTHCRRRRNLFLKFQRTIGHRQCDACSTQEYDRLDPASRPKFLPMGLAPDRMDGSLPLPPLVGLLPRVAPLTTAADRSRQDAEFAMGKCVEPIPRLSS